MLKDYVALYSEANGSDLLHFGVKGMHWGVRKPRTSGKLTSTPAGAAPRHSGGGKSSTGETHTASHTMDSIVRYNMLKRQVKQKGANSLSDDDLKFLNARTEAIGKANKAFHDKDSKIKKAVVTAIAGALTKKLNAKAEDLLNKMLDSKDKATGTTDVAKTVVKLHPALNPKYTGRSANTGAVYKVTTLGDYIARPSAGQSLVRAR